jgi:16S rRNA (adenine1518-N6/adenine1519-N6)-dimethyltransferase
VGERAQRRRALGQHFLVDPEVSARTVAIADLAPGAQVLEIGPGRGALTRALLDAGARVVAVELDTDLAGKLAARAAPALEVVEGDFLRLDLDRLPAAPQVVVANLPYSTGTAIVSRLLEHPRRFPRLVVMLQKEVAERLCAGPGSRAYAALTVLTALHAVARLAFLVPPGAFSPPPKVESAVVRLDLEPEPRVPIGDPSIFRRVVRGAFAQRRKTLRNSLRAVFGEAATTSWLAAARIDGGRRAETLSLAEFATLARIASAAGDALDEGGSTPGLVDGTT